MPWLYLSWPVSTCPGQSWPVLTCSNLSKSVLTWPVIGQKSEWTKVRHFITWTFVHSDFCPDTSPVPGNIFRWDFPFFRLSLMALNFQGNVISSTFQKPVFWLKQCLPQKIKLSAFRRNLGQPLSNIFDCWDISKTVLGVFLRKLRI